MYYVNKYGVVKTKEVMYDEVIIFRIPTALKKFLSRIALEKNTTISEVLRRMIIYCVENSEEFGKYFSKDEINLAKEAMHIKAYQQSFNLVLKTAKKLANEILLKASELDEYISKAGKCNLTIEMGEKLKELYSAAPESVKKDVNPIVLNVLKKLDMEV